MCFTVGSEQLFEFYRQKRSDMISSLSAYRIHIAYPSRQSNHVGYSAKRANRLPVLKPRVCAHACWIDGIRVRSGARLLLVSVTKASFSLSVQLWSFRDIGHTALHHRTALRAVRAFRTDETQRTLLR